MRRGIFEVERCRLKNIGAKLIPGFPFGENGMAQRARTIAAFLAVANFEINSMPRA
jgi:hypothetical protein